MMICKSCNSENIEGASFCGICGVPLLEDQPEVNSADVSENTVSDGEENSDTKSFGGDSELNTTVLTADMNPTSAPLVGFTNVDAASNENEEKTTLIDADSSSMMGVPGQPPMMAAPGMPGQPPMMAAPGMPGQPPMMGTQGMPGQPPMMGDSGMLTQASIPGNSGMLSQPAMGNSGMLGNTTDTLARTDILSKTVAIDNQRNMSQKMPKASNGNKTYMIASIAAMVVLAGGLIGSIVHFNGKVKDLEKKNQDITKEKEDMETSLNSDKNGLQTKISELEGNVNSANGTITELQDKVSAYETQIADLQNQSNAYAALDQVINYAKTAPSYGYGDFFCSNNIMHMSVGETNTISTFFDHDAGNVVYEVNDTNIATCDWDADWQGKVLGLNVTAVNPGFANIKVTNDQNDEVVNIFIYVE